MASVQTYMDLTRAIVPLDIAAMVDNVQIMTNVLQVTRVTAAPRVKIQMDRMHAPVTTATLEMDAPVEMWMNVHSTVMTVTQMHSALTLQEHSRAHVTIQTTTTATGNPAILTEALMTHQFYLVIRAKCRS